MNLHPRPAPRMRVPLFRIDPEGYVVMTWQTLGLLAGAVVWATVQYVDLRSMHNEIIATATEVRVHHDALVKNGLIPPVSLPQ